MANKTTALLTGAVLLVLSSGAWALGSRPPARSSLELVAEAQEVGKLEPGTALLYRVYAVLDPEKLPREYRGSEPIKDGTPVLREARREYPTLPRDIQEALEPYLFPGNAK